MFKSLSPIRRKEHCHLLWIKWQMSTNRWWTLQTCYCPCKSGGRFYRYFGEQDWDSYLLRRKKGAPKLSAICSTKQNLSTEQRERSSVQKIWACFLYTGYERAVDFASSVWKLLCFGQETAVDIEIRTLILCFESTTHAFLAKNSKEVPI